MCAFAKQRRFAVAIVMLSALPRCATSRDSVEAAGDGGPAALHIMPGAVQLRVGETQQFVPSGGSPPYTFTVTSGMGQIDGSGLYTAPAAPTTDVVRLQDDAGTTIDSTIDVADEVEISPQSVTVAVDNKVEFTGVGGRPPYAFEISTGQGTINPVTGEFTADVQSGTAEVRVTDTIGDSQIASVTVNPALDVAATMRVPLQGTAAIGPTGGVPPYEFRVIAGPGSVELATGVFQAGDSEAFTDVEVRDSYDNLATVEIATVLPPGTLDANFAVNGTYISQFSSLGEMTNRDVLQYPGGQIVFVGDAPSGTQSGRDLLLTRFDANGDLDSSFGVNGRAMADFGDTEDVMFAAALQPDGFLVVAGYTVESNRNLLAARFDPAGQLDAAFGTLGRVVLDFVGNETVTDVVIQSDGKIVLVGTRASGVDADFMAVRLHANGILDTTYGSFGVAIVDMATGSEDHARAAVITSGDATVIAGVSEPANEFALAQLDATGALDAGFGTLGRLSVQAAATVRATVYDAALSPSGKIVVTGSIDFHPQSGVLLRVLPDGSPDTTLNGSGTVVRSGGSLSTEYYGVSHQADGTIVVATSYDKKGRLMRYSDGGGIDSSFSMPQPTYWAKGYSFRRVFTDSSGRLLAAAPLDTFHELGLARYLPSGIADLTYQSNGRVTAGVSTPCTITPAGLVLAPAGGVFVAGKCVNASRRSIAMMRLTRLGEPDAAFGVQGTRVTLDWFAVRHITGDSNGSILAAGLNSTSPQVRRWDESGNLDTTFGSGGSASIDSNGSASNVVELAVLDDGKIITVGYQTYGGQVGMIAKHYSGGTVDANFNGGKVLVSPEGFGTSFFSVLPLSTTDYLVSGVQRNGSGAWISLLAQVTSDGGLDPSFGTDGLFYYDSGPGHSYPVGLGQLSTGRLIAAGYAESASGVHDFYVLGLAADGTLDATFGNAGVATLDIINPAYGPGDDILSSVAIQDDDRIVAVGRTTAGPQTSWVVARWLPDGALDTTFGDNGLVMRNFNSSDARALDVKIDTAGDIVVLGSVLGTRGPSIRELTVTRLRP